MTGGSVQSSASSQSNSSSGQQAPPPPPPANVACQPQSGEGSKGSEAGARNSQSLPANAKLGQVRADAKNSRPSKQSDNSGHVTQNRSAGHQPGRINRAGPSSLDRSRNESNSPRGVSGAGQSLQVETNRTGQSSQSGNRTVQSSRTPNKRTEQSLQEQTSKPPLPNQNVHSSSSRTAVQNTYQPANSSVQSRTGQSSSQANNVRTAQNQNRTVQSSNSNSQGNPRAGTIATLNVRQGSSSANTKNVQGNGSRTLPNVSMATPSTTSSSSQSNSSSHSGRPPRSSSQGSRSQSSRSQDPANCQAVVIANRGAVGGSSPPGRSSGARGGGSGPGVHHGSTQQRAASHSPQRQKTQQQVQQPNSQHRNNTHPRPAPPVSLTQSQVNMHPRPVTTATPHHQQPSRHANVPSGSSLDHRHQSRSNPNNRSSSLDTQEIHLDVLQNTNAREVNPQSASSTPNTVLHRFENNEALPDILNSHLLPPYTAPRQNQHRSPQNNNNPHHSGRNTRSNNNPNNNNRSSRSRSRSQTSSSGMTNLDGDEKECCDKECCLRCITVMSTFRWMLVTLAMIGVVCVITGIILGALHMTVGEKFLTLSLMFIGLGVLLVVVVGVGWRCTPAGHEPCHVLFNLGDYRQPSRTTRVTRQPRGNLWHGGMIYSDFRFHRRPPPSYNASMQEYERQRIRDISPAQRPGTIDNLSLPSSPPPTYRSRASTVRPGIHITFPPVSGEYPTSRPPTYRSHAGDERPPLSSISGEEPTRNNRTNDIPRNHNNTTIVMITNNNTIATADDDNSRESSPQRSLPSNDVSTLHREQEVVQYLEGIVNEQIRDLGDDNNPVVDETLSVPRSEGVNNSPVTSHESNPVNYESNHSSNRVVVSMDGSDTQIDHMTSRVDGHGRNASNLNTSSDNTKTPSNNVDQGTNVDSEIAANSNNNSSSLAENVASMRTNQNAEECTVAMQPDDNQNTVRNQIESSSSNQNITPPQQTNIVPLHSDVSIVTEANAVSASAGSQGDRCHVTVEDKIVQSSVSVKSAETQTVTPSSGEEAEVSDTQL